ncbi:mRNA-capping enzyme subunit beta [Lobaria immixta]|nr:mRNA-capping enzyme subunit beta [Lobaria immixta]
MCSGSTAVTRVIEQGSAIKKAPDALVLSSSPNRRSKRRRFDAIPIFARSCRGPNSGLINKSQSPVKEATNLIARDPGLLGPWEDSVTKVITSTESIKLLSDFLYKEVVCRLDGTVEPAESMSTAGAAIEIEAKIGQLIDKKTNVRVSMPVTTEYVLDKNEPDLRVYFKSSMTVAQQFSMNRFLNKVFKDSQNSNRRPFTDDNKPRVPMFYVHSRECDSFYELSKAGFRSLPPYVRELLGSRRSNAKVRITRDQITGNTLAQIVKIHLADLDVYSPNTEFDYRVSINLEANLKGNWRDLVMPAALNGETLKRKKNRMSYKHLAYQIDLTQVLLSDPAVSKVHELEVEMSTAEIRKHGVLLRDGQPNEFETLVQGFANNIRILASGPKYALPWWR